MSIRFSVVVPVHNNSVDLRNCIESLKALDYPRERYEIIVVDNSSTDDTAAVATSMGVTCISETQFQSSYAARNTGIKAAGGDFIAFTDSDCVVDKGWLKAIDGASGDQMVGCLAGEILSVKPTTTVERFSENIGLLRQKGPLSGWHFKPYAQTANAVYRKAVFDKIGLFDPATNSGGDAVIAWRMLDKTNYTIRFVPEAIVYHHHRTSVPALYAQFRRYGGGKMSWALSQKNYTPPAIAVLEKDVVGLFTKHLEALEAAGIDEELLFSGLRVATQAAHLSGYLQDLLRYALDDASLEKAPAIARDRAPTCNLCGSHSFVPGPNGRLASGRPPQCRDCGSLERQRILHDILSAATSVTKSKLTCLAVGEGIGRESKAFGKYFHLKTHALLEKEFGEQCDVVIAIDPLKEAAVGSFDEYLSALVAPLKAEGVLLLIQAGTQERIRVLEELVRELLPEVGLRMRMKRDAVTGAHVLVFLAAVDPNNFLKEFQ